ncbi:DNA adenine methylase [Microbacterium paludicola]|jgi:DNA adenine methylase|uniref:site-specific DNA-methyltransferase (adenine-specific) n=1 Tax=Microbacterium paludicola TaxID=300019 RepID=A0A4Y9FXS2_9MICO|nr:DNA adenine methylase [Microbacterium paludicola]MBF0816235.1 DNA adenine methylase [Microbacterium paludicola]TFU33041.1 DNA adenine methylase [Microbacterium paludicola]
MTEAVKIRASRRYGTLSPLRYPGGKAALAGLFADLISDLGIVNATYVEPYAGGAGAGIALLREDLIEHLVVNDFDPAVHAFWQSVTTRTADFVDRIASAPLTIDEWLRQREIYRAARTADPLELGFAFFYLNRTNRSGVLTGGVIGGLAQTGNYKIDARFNRDTLIDRVSSIGALRDRITVLSRDGRSVIRDYSERSNAFMYIDPPYVRAGSRLYLNSFEHRDHAALADIVNAIQSAHWLMTYDVAPLIEKLYAAHFVCRYELNYSARYYGAADELLIASPDVAASLMKGLARVPASA